MTKSQVREELRKGKNGKYAGPRGTTLVREALVDYIDADLAENGGKTA